MSQLPPGRTLVEVGKDRYAVSMTANIGDLKRRILHSPSLHRQMVRSRKSRPEAGIYPEVSGVVSVEKFCAEAKLV